MPDNDSSASEPLDQLFAAPEAAPLVRSGALASQITLPDEAGDGPSEPDLQERKSQWMRSEDMLSRLTPMVWVTPTLLTANVAIFIIMVVSGVNPLQPEIADLLKWGANYAPLTWGGQPWRLVTNIFLHCGILHLAANMWALWTAGRILERFVGNVGYLIIYFAAGIAGSLASLGWNGDVVSAGASGAIFGLLGGFAAFIWNRSDSIPEAALSRLKSSLLKCIGINLLIGLTIPVIDQAAHVGGLLSGLILGSVLSQRLDQLTVLRRPRRNMIAGAIALFGLGTAIALHSPPPPDLFKELVIYDEVVPQAIQKFNDGAKAFDSKQLSQKKFIELIENEILPDWRRVEDHLDKLTNIPRGRRELIHQIRTQLTLREEAWNLLIKALQKNDAAVFADFKAKWKQADQVQLQLQ